MKVHPVTQSYSEVRTYDILDKIMSKYGYKILASVRLCDVIKPEEGERIDEYADSLYRYGHFDFVVCHKKDNMPLFPFFAVEFDGPHHETDAIQKRRDEYKNRFCKDAGFNMLRITDEQLEGHEKVSLLAFMLERYVGWQKEYPELMKEINERFKCLDQNDPLLTEMQETGICDPSFDPSFLFDLKHPFPAILTITHRLVKKKIFTLRSHRKMMEYIRQENPKFVYCCEGIQKSVGGSTDRHSHTEIYHVMKRKGNVDGYYKMTFNSNGVETEPPGLIEVIYTVEKAVNLKWGCSVGRTLGNVPPFGIIKDIFFCELPGVHIPDIAEQLSEYLCLREIERWYEENKTYFET